MWLAFLGFPVADTVSGRGTVAWKCVALVLCGVFVLLYAAVCLGRGASWRLPRNAAGVLGVMGAIGCLLTLTGNGDWAMLFIFVASMAAALVPTPRNRQVVIGCVVVLAACLLIHGDGVGDIVAYGATTLGVGILLCLIHDLEDKNDELAAARTELARLAVTEERERFARDLHDLLGHSLSVISLKSQLAGRLVEADPAAAAREIEEVHEVARVALVEVRDAVGGYRRPSLDQELDGARAALAAAGVRVVVLRDAVSLDSEVEGALAWAVREGATNVIRHAGATRCEIRIAATLEGARVEISDDGSGAGTEVGAGALGGGGTGLRGLAERVRGLGGAVEAGPVGGGGFRLAMTVPLR